MEMLTGTEHPNVGEYYVKIGCIHQEAGQMEEGQDWFKRAFIIFQSLLGVEHELTEECYKMFMKMENLLGNKYQKLSIEDLSLRLIEEFENQAINGEFDDEFEDGEQGQIEYGGR
jgi:hypothetical protein